MACCPTVTYTVKEGELEPVLAALGPLVEGSRRENVERAAWATIDA